MYVYVCISYMMRETNRKPERDLLQVCTQGNIYIYIDRLWGVTSVRENYRRKSDLTTS